MGNIKYENIEKFLFDVICKSVDQINKKGNEIKKKLEIKLLKIISSGQMRLSI